MPGTGNNEAIIHTANTAGELECREGLHAEFKYRESKEESRWKLCFCAVAKVMWAL